MKLKLFGIFVLLVLSTQLAYAESSNDFTKVAFGNCKPAQSLTALKQGDSIYIDCALRNNFSTEIPVFIKKSQVSESGVAFQGLELHKLSPNSSTTTRTIFFVNKDVANEKYIVSLYGAISDIKDSYRVGPVIGEEQTFSGTVVAPIIKIDTFKIDKNVFVNGGRGLATIRLADDSNLDKLSNPVVLTISTKDSRGEECTALLRSESFVEKLKNLDFYVYPRDGCQEISSVSLSLLSGNGRVIKNQDFPVQFGESTTSGKNQNVAFWSALVDPRSIIVFLIILLAMFGYHYTRYKQSLAVNNTNQ